MASGYPIDKKQYPDKDWGRPNTYPKQIQTDYKPVTLNTVDPFTALQNMLDPWSWGFDRHLELFRELEDVRIKSTYPPYNIRNINDEKAEIELAIAGFRKNDVKITYKENVITVEGNRGEDDGDYSYKGIAARNFTQKFAIADDVVVNGATIEDGLLTIQLQRIIPDEKKARTIEIN